MITSTDNTAGCGLFSPDRLEGAALTVREKVLVLKTCLALENLLVSWAWGWGGEELTVRAPSQCSYLRC